ncbi:MAG TPA: pyridoxamine 5'-phosphate oxidase family protein [Aquabacterium sp.]|nr:pyridoxamine 5'-phosphate oxidase family protein [Aquabacterium sp.]
MDPNQDIERLDALIDGERVTMLSRWTRDGLLHSKPMSVLRRDPEGSFWFFIQSAPGDAEDEAQYRQCNLAFSQADKGRHVSIAGRGRVVRDRELIHSMWTAAAKPWFPEGPDAQDLALLQVVPVHAEYWDGPSNIVSRALAMAASITAGRPIGLGEHGEVDLAPPPRT